MIRLHVSRQAFTSADPRDDGRHPVPACGASRDEATVKFGRGDGLVPYPALHPNTHCPECIKIKRDQAYGGRGW